MNDNKVQMHVYKFFSGDLFWAVSGHNVSEAQEHLFESITEIKIDRFEEIPETEWDEQTINIWEDNDTETEPFKMSIRECLENTPTILFTNDLDFL